MIGDGEDDRPKGQGILYGIFYLIIDLFKLIIKITREVFKWIMDNY